MRLFREFIIKNRPELIEYTRDSRTSSNQLRQMYRTILSNNEILILHGEYMKYRLEKINSWNKKVEYENIICDPIR
jgi:hypothetical protein